MKLPAFQFYPADWRKDPGIQSLTRHDQSVWFDMLCLMHESDERGVLLLAGKPMPIEALGRILNLDEILLKQILSTLLTYGVASERQEDGAIYNRRMVRDEKLIQIRREAGKLGGNPVLLKQNPTTPVKQNPTPSSSSSSSFSTSVSSTEEIKSNGKESTPAGEEDEVFEIWNSFNSLTKIAKISTERKAKAKTRLKDSFFREHWKAAISSIPNTPFLMGQNSKGWKADIDWFLKPESLTRIIEGKYISAPSHTQSSPPPRNMDVSGKTVNLPQSKQY